MEKGILFCLLLSLIMGAPDLARAQDKKLCQWIKKGGDVPVPYKKISRRVELADGEYYALHGRVIFIGKKPYLQVNFDSHPWLGNQRRLKDPLYPLTEKGPVDWRSYDDREIRLVVRALGEISKGLKPHYTINLEPAMYPYLIQRPDVESKKDIPIPSIADFESDFDEEYFED